jgi:hypothetical protein
MVARLAGKSRNLKRVGIYRHRSRMRAAISIRGPWLAALAAASVAFGQLVRSNNCSNASGMKRVRVA